MLIERGWIIRLRFSRRFLVENVQKSQITGRVGAMSFSLKTIEFLWVFNLMVFYKYVKAFVGINEIVLENNLKAQQTKFWKTKTQMRTEPFQGYF